MKTATSNARAKRAVLAGNVLVDVVKTVDAWPEQGMLASITAQKRACGGAVCNSGTFLKTLDPSLDVCACGKTGTDEYGDWVLSFLSGRGIDVSRVRRTPDAPTSYTDVVTVASTGARTFFHYRASSALFSQADIDLDSLDCDIFHLGYLLLLDALDAPDPEYGTKAARLLHDVQARGIRTSIDIVSGQPERFRQIVPPALRYCDHLVVNEIEGGLAAGLPHRGADGRVTASSLRKIAESLLEAGVRRSVTLHSPEMGVTLSAAGEFTAVGSLELPDGWIRGSVGAGDAFCAGMLYAFMKGLSDEEGMKVASCAAAANLAALDSISGALPLDRTMELERYRT